MAKKKEKRTDIGAITSDLSSAYANAKKYGTEKDGYRKEFFEAINDSFTEEDLARKTLRIPKDTAPTEPDAREYALKRHPLFTIQTTQEDGDDWIVGLRENRQFKRFVFINTNTNEVWQRQVTEGSPYLDDDALREDDPELWLEVSEIPDMDLLSELLYEANVDHEEIADWLDEHYPANRRVLKDLDSMTAAQLAAIDPYVFYGPPTAKLPAPRAPKPEELEEDE